MALDKKRMNWAAGWHWTKEHEWGATGFASAACVLTFGVFVGRSSDGASKSDALPLQGCIPNGTSAKRPNLAERRGGVALDKRE